MNEEDKKELEELKQKVETLTGLVRNLASPDGSVQSRGITLADVDARINQRLLGPEEKRLVTVNVSERIRELIKNDVIAQTEARIRTFSPQSKKASWQVFQKKQTTAKDLYNFVYDKTGMQGRIPGSFYSAVLGPIVEASLIIGVQKEGYKWCLEERLAEKINPEDAKAAAEYLTSLIL